MNNQLTINDASTEFLLYSTPSGEVKVEVLLNNETLWLTQKRMAELFNVDRSVISKHLKNIFADKELDEKGNVQKMHTANSDKPVSFYNLDAVISVGYRVNSSQATQFRIWATKQLKEYIIKGFVIDDERLKNPNNPFGTDYFDQLEEKIRDIRTSERRFYQKITDIYITSVDYNKDGTLTKDFFATVQNKMHFGIHGKTAAEVIANRADSTKPNMGITCVSENSLKKSDIFIAKNYLTKDEISELNLIVEQYLAFAELQARNKKAMTMQGWIVKLDDFLRLNEKEILQNKGRISKSLADKMAGDEYIMFKQKQLAEYESDFDRVTKSLLEDNGDK